MTRVTISQNVPFAVRTQSYRRLHYTYGRPAFLFDILPTFVVRREQNCLKRLTRLSKLVRLRSSPDKARLHYHFIHIPKNAGNSVRAAISRRRDVSVSDPYHYRYVDIADKVGRHLRFFSVIRNPWSRTASRFVFAKQNAKSWAADDPRRVYIERATFEDFVRDQMVFEIPEHPGMPWMGPMNSWFNQLEWITDEQGDVVCDNLRFEFLNEDLNRYLADNFRLRRRNVTRGKSDYRQMYTDELIEIVANSFKADIEYFGFDFQGAATKNTWG